MALSVPGPVSLASGSSSFLQQGSVDWVSFAKTVWTVNAEVFGRLATSGVQPNTFVAGILLAEQYQLSTNGRRHMEDALANPPVQEVLMGIVYMGFGIKSLVRTLRETIGGTKVIALCCCLAETHTEKTAAYVLTDMWRKLGWPEEHEPDHLQFLALVKCCSGIIIRSTFVETVQQLHILIKEALVDIDNMNRRLPSYLLDLSIPRIGRSLSAASSAGLAAALLGLFEVSRGELDHMTVNGGIDCAFIAALAEWLLGLTVRIETIDGVEIRSNAPNHQPAQVTILIGHVDNSLTISGRFFELKSYDEVFDRVLSHQEKHFMTRVPWDSCLSNVFGAAFNRLITAPKPLGRYLGSAARLYAGLALGEEDPSGFITDHRFSYVNFTRESYGAGLVNLIFDLLPELRQSKHLRLHMEEALQESIEDTVINLEQSLEDLVQLCGCHYCHEGDTNDCLTGIAYAILSLARTMSSVIVETEDSKLPPSAEGLEFFAHPGRGVYGRRDWEADNSPSSSQWYADHFFHSMLILGGSDVDEYESLLYKVSLLYHGLGVPERDALYSREETPVSAIAVRGICCYLAGLRSLSSKAEHMAKVHVIPGRIYHKGREYSSIEDCVDMANDDLRRICPEVQVETILTAPVMPIRPPSPCDIVPVAATSGDGRVLYCSYRIKDPSLTVYIHPGKLTRNLSLGTGRITCHRGKQCGNQLALPCMLVRAGVDVFSFLMKPRPEAHGNRCCLWTLRDEVTRWYAMVLDNPRYLFVRRHECIPCATKACVDYLKFLPSDGNAFSPTVHVI
ncbi:hypothetical protein MMC25_000921 [Agyrium rufum]|nr:hypothetical protein [Agyrium rufum]